MALKRVIIHLGIPKTGTSSIQETLFSNTAILEQNNFRYLTEWGINHYRNLNYLISEHPVYPLGTGHFGRDPGFRNSAKKLQMVINNTPCENLIISGEYFHELYLDSTIVNIKKFIQKHFYANGIDVAFVIFKRNPLDWIISYLQQKTFTQGFHNKQGAFFEWEMRRYTGVINFYKHFHSSLKILKFEDACLDKDGLVGCFLKTIGFHEEKLTDVVMRRANESRSIEVMEFVCYMESIEPLYPSNYRSCNPNRFKGDLDCMKNIKGAKFDLSYQGKIELWNYMQETIHLLKENTGIDYTSCPPCNTPQPSLYSEETIQEFIKVFPKLSIVLQKYFLKFFEKRYMETGILGLKQLFYKGSIPFKIYNSKNVFTSLLSLRVYSFRKNLKYKKAKSPMKGKNPLKLIKKAFKRIRKG